MDIDFKKTRDAFIASGIKDFDTFFQQSYSNPLFAGLETGIIDPKDFYEAFRNEAGVPLSDEIIRENWNALLGDFRKKSVEYLGSLKNKYRVFLFSNTNLIHYEAFMILFDQQFGGGNFHDYFEKAYYSHELKRRKPEVDSFRFILKENSLQAGETLFVDDTLKNIEGALAAGMQTLWLQGEMRIEDQLPILLNTWD